jgi:hypothetical protein
MNMQHSTGNPPYSTPSYWAVGVVMLGGARAAAGSRPPSGSAGAPARAAMRIGRPEITAIRALEVHQRPLVAQQVLPVRIAVSAVPAVTTFGAVIAARAGQPCAAAAVGGRINR